jgi:GNAT superfamily N-acetyltransferase
MPQLRRTTPGPCRASILLRVGEDPKIRTLDRAELETVLDWAAAEGWNPGLHDADAFFAADPAGFLGLEIAGELAVSISVVRYDETFAFVGFYICRPDLRGRGLGAELFDTALERRPAAVLGLDAVLEQESTYVRDGFVTAHHSIRFGGAVPSLPRPVAELRVLGASDVDELVTFERHQHVFPAARGAFLERWIAAPGTTACAIGERGEIDGYGVVRACRVGCKIGPMFCADRLAAERLLGALFVHADAGPVFLDVPVPNIDGMALAGDLGLEPMFETARMYRGDATDLRLDRIFGITSFELG